MAKVIALELAGTVSKIMSIQLKVLFLIIKAPKSGGWDGERGWSDQFAFFRPLLTAGWEFLLHVP